MPGYFPNILVFIPVIKLQGKKLLLRKNIQALIFCGIVHIYLSGLLGLDY